MATQQNEGGVPFSVAHDFRQFRLLELPPEIVELLEAPNPPRLTIKSQAPSSTADPKAAYAVLCTPQKTFQLRQVQTSNSLFVTQTTFEAHGDEIPVPTTCAIASCSATLELHPTDGSAVSYLEEALPVYDLISGEIDAVENRKSKESIFGDVPLSDAHCERAWAELIAFELKGSSYSPSANTISQVWQSINAAALAEGIKLDSQFIVEDMARLVEDEGYPSSLAAAILRSLAHDNQKLADEWASLDRMKTVPFIGKTLLEAKAGSSDYLTADFLEAWKDSLPESWRKDAELTALNGAFDLPSSMTICAKSKRPTAGDTAPATPQASSSKGKWHEKFGKMRKK